MRRAFLTLTAGLALVVCPLTLPAQSVTVAWNPSATGTVTGYLLYQGSDGINFQELGDAKTNTSVTVTNLQAGVTNYFEVVAYDAHYDLSPPSALLQYSGPKQIVVPNAPVVVASTIVTNPNTDFALRITGNGTLSPKRNAQAYLTGKTYTLTAAAAKGSVLANWVSNGVVVATTPKYTFTVESNLAVQANFILNPFVPAVGTYHGLFWVTNDAATENSGSFTATVTKTGAFSARLSFGGRSYPFSGEFSVNGVALKSIQRPELSPITVQLQLDLTANNPMTGTVSDGSWTAELVADPAVYSRTNTAPQAGKYTLLMPGSTNASGQPSGNSFGAVTVSVTGNITVSGTLGDGTAFTSASVVSTNIGSSQGQWPVYVSLYGGKGSILGWLSFTNDGDINGQVAWLKLPQPAAKFYSTGFTNSLEVIGSAYHYTNGLPVPDFTKGQLLLTDGNLTQNITSPFVLGANNETTAPSSKLTFNASSGLFKGSVMNPETSRPILVSGVILQNQKVGAGLFLGTTAIGSVLLSPAQ